MFALPLLQGQPWRLIGVISHTEIFCHAIFNMLQNSREGHWYWSHSLGNVPMDWGWPSNGRNQTTEPNNQNGHEHCGELRKGNNYAWNDAYCLNEKYAICQYWRERKQCDCLKLHRRGKQNELTRYIVLGETPSNDGGDPRQNRVSAFCFPRLFTP